LRWKDKPECRGKIEGKSLLYPWGILRLLHLGN